MLRAGASARPPLSGNDPKDSLRAAPNVVASTSEANSSPDNSLTSSGLSFTDVGSSERMLGAGAGEGTAVAHAVRCQRRSKPEQNSPAEN
jgi:hypothetical protein